MKKTIALILALALAVCLLPAGALAVDGVKYIDAAGAEKKANGVTEIETVDDIPKDSTNNYYLTGWYVVTGNVIVSSSITVTGDVHLILADGCSLTVGHTQLNGVHNNKEASIIVNEGNNLTIYGQTGGTGALTVTNAPDRSAAIGSVGVQNSGIITICGGTIEAKGGISAAGIGSGSNASDDGGKMGTVNIHGGTIDATGDVGGAGIGSGKYGKSKVTITGGTITATSGGRGGAGIGSGEQGDCTVIISGGKIDAKGGNYGAGIGGGDDGDGEVIISGGEIIATGGTDAAGIGGGENYDGKVTISGGTVTAIGNGGGAGIGGGDSGGEGIVTISGGTITATGGIYYNIINNSSNNAPGVGGGIGSDDSLNKVEITDSSVTAEISADNSTWEVVSGAGNLWNAVKAYRYFRSTAPTAPSGPALVPLIPQVNVPVYRLPEYIEAEEVVEDGAEDAQPEEVPGDVPDVEEGTADAELN